jgi:hypothetical protein
MGEAWLRRWLFRCSLAVAATLIALIVIAPWLGGDDSLFGRLLHLFGHDLTVRRTGLAGAAGLGVTALVFFQPAGRPAHPPDRPPADVTGA